MRETFAKPSGSNSLVHFHHCHAAGTIGGDQSILVDDAAYFS